MRLCRSGGPLSLIHIYHAARDDAGGLVALVSMTDIAGLLRDKEDESTLIPEVEVSEIEALGLRAKWAAMVRARAASCRATARHSSKLL